MQKLITKNDFYQFQNDDAKQILYCDTDSMFIHIDKIKPKTSEEAVEIGERLNNEVNEIIVDYYEKQIKPLMNVINRHISYKTELVIESIIMLSVKKNYAIKVISKKGKVYKEPEISYVGIPVKRTDFSKFTKDFIKELLDLALDKNTDFTDKQYIKTTINQIGIKYKEILSKDLSEFNFEYIGTPGKWGIKEYDVDPALVISGKLYNTITETETFKPGSNGYIIPIRVSNTSIFDKVIKNSNYFIDQSHYQKLNYILIPYNYNKEILKKSLLKYGVTINEPDVWEKLLAKILISIIQAIKNKANIR